MIYYIVEVNPQLYFFGGAFMQRNHVRKSTDFRIFRSTADRSKLINVKPIIMRGGIRL